MARPSMAAVIFSQAKLSVTVYSTLRLTVTPSQCTVQLYVGPRAFPVFQLCVYCSAAAKPPAFPSWKPGSGIPFCSPRPPA